MTQRFLGVLGLAEALGVSRHAVHKWRARHPAGSDRPFPEPDVEVDGAPGWAEAKVADVMQWREELPGRGAGGGRPSLVRRRYLDMALTRGLDHDEATRALRTFMDHFPDRSEAEVCEWIMGKWSD